MPISKTSSKWQKFKMHYTITFVCIMINILEISFFAVSGSCSLIPAETAKCYRYCSVTPVRKQNISLVPTLWHHFPAKNFEIIKNMIFENDNQWFIICVKVSGLTASKCKKLNESEWQLTVIQYITWLAAALVNATFAVVVMAFSESPVPKITWRRQVMKAICQTVNLC